MYRPALNCLFFLIFVVIFKNLKWKLVLIKIDTQPHTHTHTQISVFVCVVRCCEQGGVAVRRWFGFHEHCCWFEARCSCDFLLQHYTHKHTHGYALTHVITSLSEFKFHNRHAGRRSSSPEWSFQMLICDCEVTPDCTQLPQSLSLPTFVLAPGFLFFPCHLTAAFPVAIKHLLILSSWIIQDHAPIFEFSFCFSFGIKSPSKNK